MSYTAANIAICIIALLGSTRGEKQSVERPVIGIFPTGSDSYLHAYQEWVEQFGARSVILPESVSSAEKLEHVFQSLNALLVPGGGENLKKFAKDLMIRAR